MKLSLKYALVIISVFLLAASASAVTVRNPARRPTEPNEERALIQAAHEMRRAGIVWLNFKDIDLAKFVYFMSELLDENIVMPSLSPRKITVISPHPVTISEAREMMISALSLHDLQVKDNGGYLLVQMSENQKTSGSATQTRVPSKTVKAVVLSPDAAISADIIDRYINFPLEEAKYTRFRPTTNLNKGLEVQWIHDASIFRMLGVRRGDIIMAVNGIKIGNLNSIDEIIHSLMKRERFDIEVLRKTSDIQIDLQNGKVSPQIVDQLVNNPFDELKRVRFKPSETAGGLTVQWLQNDSILKRLGFQKGDVIKSVNGIPFTNMVDITNSVNSLMNSERFDIEIIRNGKSIVLHYVVSDPANEVIHLNHPVIRETNPISGDQN